MPAHAGILKALEELDISFDTLVGISGGSVVAALYANGVSHEKMLDIAINTNFKQYVDFSIVRLMRSGGLCSGKRFEKWLDEQLDGKTFADLNYDFHVIATDLTGGGPVVFNKEKSPNVKVSRAVICSMAIPLIFSSQEYKDHLLVDGAILAEDALFHDWRGDGTPNVCFRLRSSAGPQPYNRSKRFILPQYINMLIKTFMNALSREYVNAKLWHQTIVVDSGTTSATDFDMSPNQKTMLYKAGYKTVMDYLPIKLVKVEV